MSPLKRSMESETGLRLQHSEARIKPDNGRLGERSGGVCFNEGERRNFRSIQMNQNNLIKINTDNVNQQKLHRRNPTDGSVPQLQRISEVPHQRHQSMMNQTTDSNREYLIGSNGKASSQRRYLLKMEATNKRKRPLDQRASWMETTQVPDSTVREAPSVTYSKLHNSNRRPLDLDSQRRIKEESVPYIPSKSSAENLLHT